MSARTILVDVRDVYGRETIYPACETAELLAQLAGTRTLTPAALATIRALGYSVELKPRPLPAVLATPAAERPAPARHWTGGPLRAYIPGLLAMQGGRA